MEDGEFSISLYDDGFEWGLTLGIIAGVALGIIIGGCIVHFLIS